MSKPKPRILDLYCGAGGAAMGYYRAGFEVVGVDINPQPKYPFEFHQADALNVSEWWRHLPFAVIHASPPCQTYSMAARLHPGSETNHPDLVDPTRKLLEASGLPWVIENVDRSPLRGTMMLCGSMFGLRIRKHRYFEVNWPMSILAPASCDHRNLYDPYHGPGRTTAEYQTVQETPWMPGQGGSGRARGVTGDVSNAIPPAYTEWIGRQLLQVVERAA
jgi:DNA (cytosine-5)-methyltransferase 1